MDKISSWNQVPSFDSLEEEQEYWGKHQLDPVLLQAACIKNSGNESTTITLRMDPRMLARLKRLAGQRYLNYQSMLKQWVAERLERELDTKNNG
ncbi:MAG: CopG family antitoxin [Verrucomicrobiota bacterium]